MNAIINKGYKPNMTIDMVHAAIKHYARWSRPIDTIELDHRKWSEFRSGMLELRPEWEGAIDEFNQVMFKNCTVKKGSEFMIKSMVVNLKELIIDESYKQKQKQLKELA